jgi:hypothetical protein
MKKLVVLYCEMNKLLVRRIYISHTPNLIFILLSYDLKKITFSSCGTEELVELVSSG